MPNRAAEGGGIKSAKKREKSAAAASALTISLTEFGARKPRDGPADGGQPGLGSWKMRDFNLLVEFRDVGCATEGRHSSVAPPLARRSPRVEGVERVGREGRGRAANDIGAATPF
ncbi:hypothetical protein KM043_011625 [Ampulex compressa]|nr:hypothetical protein KM043_011625 [Ampulex compressa]